MPVAASVKGVYLIFCFGKAREYFWYEGMIKILFLEVIEEYVQWESEDYGNVREERKG